MAKNKSTVYLGYGDEEIVGKHHAALSSTVNKIGGTADWPCTDIKVPSCPLCSSARPLLLQLYAPLEQSQFHRTLYIFACLNPICSQNSKNWLCVRTQHLDTQSHAADLIGATPPPPAASGAKKKKQQKQSVVVALASQGQKISWCSGADDWGEEMDTAADDFGQQHEENGNVIAKNDNSPQQLPLGGIGGDILDLSRDDSEAEQNEGDEDEDDDDSASMENELICGFGQLDMHSPQNSAEDPNANCAAGVADVVGDGVLASGAATAMICAEIEGAETDVVLVETPKKPERDLIALLKHTPSSAAFGPLAKLTDVTLKSYFIAVDVEVRQRQSEYEHYCGTLSEDHIRELYQDYKEQDEATHSPIACSGGGGAASVGGGATSGGGAAAVVEEQESYEKSLPAHGDWIFHQFVTTLQQNPGQILRYSRDTLPLLIAPLAEAVPKCQNCNGETICEVQILSTLIPKLRLHQNGERAPIEYGNVLVFTCLKSCWDTPDKMRYERVIVQAEK